MLLLTASRPNKPVNSNVHQKADTDAVPETNNPPKRILIVEDNDLNRQMLHDYIVFCGYQVLSLRGGSGFFEALAEFQPQLILLDLKLPDIDGYTLLQQLQQSIEWGNIPVIIVSAFAFKADQQRALNLGASRYFVKPVSLSKLKQAIADELDNFKI